MNSFEKSPVQTLVISDQEMGQRIDNYLITRLKGLPKSRLYRLLRKGEVRVNKKRIRAEYRLQKGDLVRIPPVRLAQKAEIDEGQAKMVAERLANAILYEDDDLLILNKPAGLAVHGGTDVKVGLIEALSFLRPDAPLLGLAHRLDRDTSGCLLIAKNRTTLNILHHLFRTHAIHKTYLALTSGHFAKPSTLVDFALSKNLLSSGERMTAVMTEGKKSVTEFKVKKIFSKMELVEAILHTGRTHQIRVHAEASHHPIAGDGKYGDRDFNLFMRKNYGLRRLFLHAMMIQFTIPETGKRIQVSAPLPGDLEKVLHKMGIK